MTLENHLLCDALSWAQLMILIAMGSFLRAGESLIDLQLQPGYSVDNKGNAILIRKLDARFCPSWSLEVRGPDQRLLRRLNLPFEPSYVHFDAEKQRLLLFHQAGMGAPNSFAWLVLANDLILEPVSHCFALESHENANLFFAVVAVGNQLRYKIFNLEGENLAAGPVEGNPEQPNLALFPTFSLLGDAVLLPQTTAGLLQKAVLRPIRGAEKTFVLKAPIMQAKAFDQDRAYFLLKNGAVELHSPTNIEFIQPAKNQPYTAIGLGRTQFFAMNKQQMELFALNGKYLTKIRFPLLEHFEHKLKLASREQYQRSFVPFFDGETLAFFDYKQQWIIWVPDIFRMEKAYGLSLKNARLLALSPGGFFALETASSGACKLSSVSHLVSVKSLISKGEPHQPAALLAKPLEYFNCTAGPSLTSPTRK